MKVRYACATNGQGIYIYTPDDQVMEGEVDTVKVYEEPDFNRKIVIDERKRVELFLAEIDQRQKIRFLRQPAPCAGRSGSRQPTQGKQGSQLLPPGDR